MLSMNVTVLLKLLRSVKFDEIFAINIFMDIVLALIAFPFTNILLNIGTVKKKKLTISINTTANL